jgi:transcriptional regulator with XRE-family HTH domain
VSGISRAFRDRLRLALREDPRSQREVARVSGYSDAYISRLLNGKRSNPTLGFVETMALMLGRDPAWMLGLKEKSDD